MLTLKGRRVPLRLVPTLFLLSNHEDLGDDDNHEDGDGDKDDGVQENEYNITPLFEGYYEKNTRNEDVIILLLGNKYEEEHGDVITIEYEQDVFPPSSSGQT